MQRALGLDERCSGPRQMWISGTLLLTKHHTQVKLSLIHSRAISCAASGGTNACPPLPCQHCRQACEQRSCCCPPLAMQIQRSPVSSAAGGQLGRLMSAQNTCWRPQITALLGPAAGRAVHAHARVARTAGLAVRGLTPARAPAIRLRARPRSSCGFLPNFTKCEGTVPWCWSYPGHHRPTQQLQM